MKIWINRVLNILLFSILGMLFLFVISSKIMGESPKILGYEIMNVLSGSMEPGIKTGSIIAIQPLSETKDLKKGDVITYKSAEDPNKIITHRILQVKKIDSKVVYVTKGDNNDAKDPVPIPSENVIGKYADFTIPFFGFLLTFIKSKMGAILLLIVPGVIIVISSLISLFKAIAKMDDVKDPSSI